MGAVVVLVAVPGLLAGWVVARIAWAAWGASSMAWRGLGWLLPPASIAVAIAASGDASSAWLVAAIPCTVFAATVYWMIGQRGFEQQAFELLSRSGIAEIDAMDGHSFEAFLVTLFSRKGYKVARSQQSGDFGADLVIEREDGRTCVQAKRYSRSVGNHAVMEVVASMRHYGAQRALVVTNNYFTPAAIIQAQENGVELWDRDRLISEIVS